MSISDNAFLLYAMIFLLVGGAIGAWFTRILLRYPFGRGPLTGKESMIGKKASVVTKRHNTLRVAINSQVWNAEAPEPELIEKGQTVIVTDVENLTLKVVPYEGSDRNVSSLASENQTS